MTTAPSIHRRLTWITEENAAIKEKTLQLVADLPLDDTDQALWVEISEHIANVESHAENALRLIQRTEAQPQPTQPVLLFGLAEEAIKNLITYFSDVEVAIVPLLNVLERVESLNSLVVPLLPTKKEKPNG